MMQTGAVLALRSVYIRCEYQPWLSAVRLQDTCKGFLITQALRHKRW